MLEYNKSAEQSCFHEDAQIKQPQLNSGWSQHFLLASCGVSNLVHCRCTESLGSHEDDNPTPSLLSWSIIRTTADPQTIPHMLSAFSWSVCVRLRVCCAPSVQWMCGCASVGVSCLLVPAVPSLGPGGRRTEVHCVLLMSVSSIIASELGLCASMSLRVPSSAWLYIWRTVHLLLFFFIPS